MEISFIAFIFVRVGPKIQHILYAVFLYFENHNVFRIFCRSYFVPGKSKWLIELLDKLSVAIPIDFQFNVLFCEFLENGGIFPAEAPLLHMFSFSICSYHKMLFYSVFFSVELSCSVFFTSRLPNKANRENYPSAAVGDRTVCLSTFIVAFFLLIYHNWFVILSNSWYFSFIITF